MHANQDKSYVVIMNTPSKSYEFDLLPKSLLKNVLEDLLPLIAESYVPANFKRSHIRPRIKKLNMDKEVIEYHGPTIVVDTRLESRVST